MQQFDYRTVIEAPVTKQSARGRVKVLVVEDGKVVHERPWQNNLILDQGLNEVANRSWADCMTRCVAGTGTTPTKDDSGAITASQALTTVTAGSAFFAAGDVGKVIKWDSGAEAYITAFTDNMHVTVGTSQTVAAGEFTLYRVNQTGLAAEAKRTSTYLTGAGNCGTTNGGTSGVTSLTSTHRRTFDFTAETGNTNYSEIGLSWTSTVGNNLFSRILFDGGAVTVLTGQQLRIVYDLQITLSPSVSPVAKTASVTGWPVAPSTTTDGDECVQLRGLAVVDTSGVTQTFAGTAQGGPGNEPYYASQVFLSPSSAALAAPGVTVPDRGTNSTLVTAALSTYVAGSFTRDKTATFAVGSANRTDWRSMGYGTSDTLAGANSCNASAFVFLFDQVQAKANTHTLTLTFRTTWGRTL